MTSHVMGIDMGTGSTKGVLAALDGTIRRVATRSHEMSMPRPGFAEMDAENLWWREICEISTELLDGSDGTLAGVCVSGLGPSLVVTGGMIFTPSDRPSSTASTCGPPPRSPS